MALRLLNNIRMKNTKQKPNEVIATYAQLNQTRSVIVSKIEAFEKKVDKRFAEVDKKFTKLESDIAILKIEFAEFRAEMTAIMNRVLLIVEEQKLYFSIVDENFAEADERLKRLEGKDV